MLHAKRSRSSRRPDSTIEFLEVEVERLREIVAALRVASGVHDRRISELRHELDRLKGARRESTRANTARPAKRFTHRTAH